MTYEESKLIEETMIGPVETEDDGYYMCAVRGCREVDVEGETKLCVEHYAELVEEQARKWGEPQYEV